MAGDTPMITASSLRGIILFAHGSRDVLWRLPIEAVATRIKAKAPDALCMCAYLELTAPDLDTASAHLIAQGATQITVLPMFLGTGRHARNDLPVLVEKLRSTYPQVPFHIATAVGEDPRVTDLLAEIALQHIA